MKRTISILLLALAIAACADPASESPQPPGDDPVNNVANSNTDPAPNNADPNPNALTPTPGDLTVSDAAARSCELVVTFDAPTTPDAVRFGDGIEGTVIARGERFGVAFVSLDEGPIPPGAVSFAGAPTILTSHCYDPAGQELPNSVLAVTE